MSLLSTRRFSLPPPFPDACTPCAVQMPAGTRLLGLQPLGNKVYVWALGKFNGPTIAVGRKLVIVPGAVGLPIGPAWLEAPLVGQVTAGKDGIFFVFDLGEDATLGAPPQQAS